MYYVEGTHPAIISREVFDRAQKEMAARYGVEVKNGRAEPAGYLYHGGDYEKPDYHSGGRSGQRSSGAGTPRCSRKGKKQ